MEQTTDIFGLAQQLQSALIENNQYASITITSTNIDCKRKTYSRPLPYQRKPKNVGILVDDIMLALSTFQIYPLPALPDESQVEKQIQYYYNLIQTNEYPEIYLYYKIGEILTQQRLLIDGDTSLTKNQKKKLVQLLLEKSIGKTNIRTRFNAAIRLYAMFKQNEELLLQQDLRNVSVNTFGKITEEEFRSLYHKIKEVIDSYYLSFEINSSQELNLEEKIMLPDDITPNP